MPLPPVQAVARAPEILLLPGGGAGARVPDGTMAIGQRDAPFNIHITSLWEDPADDDANIAWTREFSAAIRPFTTGRVYVNFIGDEGEERVVASFGAEGYRRLQALKDTYDPGNVFRTSQNVRPTRSEHRGPHRGRAGRSRSRYATGSTTSPTRQLARVLAAGGRRRPRHALARAGRPGPASSCGCSGGAIELDMTLVRIEPYRLVEYTSEQRGLPVARHSRHFDADGRRVRLPDRRRVRRAAGMAGAAGPPRRPQGDRARGARDAREPRAAPAGVGCGRGRAAAPRRRPLRRRAARGGAGRPRVVAAQRLVGREQRLPGRGRRRFAARRHAVGRPADRPDARRDGAARRGGADHHGRQHPLRR